MSVTKRGNWRSFEDAREYARSLGLKSYKEWVAFGKSGQRPPDIPGKPNDTYKDDGWVSWPDWLGTNRRDSRTIPYRPFLVAREYARSLELKSYKEWVKFAKSEQKPPDIPGRPDHAYEDDGWVSMPDWLGTDSKSRKTPVDGWRPFEDAREYARSLGLKRSEE